MDETYPVTGNIKIWYKNLTDLENHVNAFHTGSLQILETTENLTYIVYFSGLSCIGYAYLLHYNNTHTGLTLVMSQKILLPSFKKKSTGIIVSGDANETTINIYSGESSRKEIMINLAGIKPVYNNVEELKDEPEITGPVDIIENSENQVFIFQHTNHDCIASSYFMIFNKSDSTLQLVLSQKSYSPELTKSASKITVSAQNNAEIVDRKIKNCIYAPFNTDG